MNFNNYWDWDVSSAWKCLFFIVLSNSLSISTSQWISDGSDEVQIDGNVVSCENCSAKSFNEYNAMWKEGDGYHSGEHYWTISFDSVNAEFPVMVGLSNKAKFKRGFNTEGLFYKGNNHRCPARSHIRQIFEFGPLIKSGDSVGILTSFETDKKLKVYFFLNNSSLGLAFDIDASIIPGVHPVVQFTGPGSATIKKETKIPSSRLRVSNKLEGDWKLIRNSTSFVDDDVFDFDDFSSFLYNPDLASIIVTQAGKDVFDVCLNVLNYISFQVEKTEAGWKTKEIYFHSHLGGIPELDEFEMNLNELVMRPDSVKVKNDELIFKHANKTVSFERKKGLSKVIKRNPFQ